MAKYVKWYLCTCLAFCVFAAVVLFLGYKYGRFPEMLIVTGCGFLIVTIIYIARAWTVISVESETEAYAGRVIMDCDILCSYNAGRSSMVHVSLCKNGMLVKGAGIEYVLMPYDSIAYEVDDSDLSIKLECIWEDADPDVFEFTSRDRRVIADMCDIISADDTE